MEDNTRSDLLKHRISEDRITIWQLEHANKYGKVLDSKQKARWNVGEQNKGAMGSIRV